MRPDRMLVGLLCMAALCCSRLAAQAQTVQPQTVQAPSGQPFNQPPLISSGASPLHNGNLTQRPLSQVGGNPAAATSGTVDSSRVGSTDNSSRWNPPDAAWTSPAASMPGAVTHASGAGNMPPSNVVPASAESGGLNLRAQNGIASPGSSSSASNSSTEAHRPLKPPSSSDGSVPKSKSTSTTQMLVSVISSLLIVLSLVVGAAWCYRKAAPGSQSAMPKMVVSVIGRTPLAPRQQLVLLRFGSKLVLVSNLQGEVRTISEVTDPLEVDRLAGMCESAQAGSVSASFRTVLNNLGRAS